MKIRCTALDVLRALTVFGMILSAIEPHGVFPPWMYHIQNPPPTHELDMTVSGISWVDMVFPIFIFCMGAAIPMAFGAKFGRGSENSPSHTSEFVGSTFTRFIGLWFFSYAYVFLNFNDQSGIWPQIATLLGFGCFFLVYGNIQSFIEKWMQPKYGAQAKMKAHLTANWLKIAGVCLMVILILIGHCCFGEVLSVQRRGIIIFLLAFLYLFGSLIWYFTSKSLLWRAAAFTAIFIFTLVTKELGWPATTYANPDIRWWFNVEYIYFLLILIPATFIGELLMKYPYGISPTKEEAEFPCSSREIFIRRDLFIAIFALIFLIWGIAMKSLEGGMITKVPCRISYCFVTLGISMWLLQICALICKYFPKSWLVRTFSGTGQNPLMCYIAYDNFLVPFMKATCLIELYKAAYPEGMPLVGLARAIITVLLLMWLVSLMSRKKIFWKA